jgi:hypothetical protein
MSDYNAERLGELIAALPPAPQAWVRAAQELPSAWTALDEIVSLAVADAEFLSALVADLEATLARAGYEPHPVLLDAVRARISDL